MNEPTPKSLKYVKFNTEQCQVEISMDDYEEQLKIRIMSLKNKNIYQASLDQSTLPEDLKMFLSNIRTVYEYIDVNKTNSQKILIQETGKIHLVFMLSFGPNSQIKKEIIITADLKQVGVAEGSDIKQNFDKLKEEIIGINQRFENDTKKLKAIILSVEKTNQRLIVESQALKLQNIQFKKKFQVIEQKVDSLEILLKDLYFKYETLKQQKQELDTKLQQIKKIKIIPQNLQESTFKKQIHHIIQSSQKDSQQSIIKRIKALEEQRDEEKKNFQQKLAQRQRVLSQKMNDLQLKPEHNSMENSRQSFSSEGKQMMLDCLKDSDFQQFRNNISPRSSNRGKRQYVKIQDKQCALTSASTIVSGLQRKIGLTGKYYCGLKLCNDSACGICKGPCGPFTGQNCSKCMQHDLQRRGLKKGFLINANGQVSWLQNGHFCCGTNCQNGSYNCGLNQKYCQECRNLTETYQHRYKQLI